MVGRKLKIKEYFDIFLQAIVYDKYHHIQLSNICKYKIQLFSEYYIFVLYIHSHNKTN